MLQAQRATGFGSAEQAARLGFGDDSCWIFLEKRTVERSSDMVLMCSWKAGTGCRPTREELVESFPDLLYDVLLSVDTVARLMGDYWLGCLPHD